MSVRSWIVTDIIHVEGLIRRFGRTRALDGFDLRVAAGEVHGFLGPNGAGKSTTLRILLGLTRAHGGTARVLERDPWREHVAVHRDLAYIPGDVSLWPGLTGGEAIDLLTRLRGGADPALRERLVRDFELDERKRARGYSKGNRQKVALVAAFARRARLYLLDEPTSGLDPVMEAVFRREVHRVREEGATVLLSSHILSEVEQLADRVTIIRAGRAVESGSLADLRHLTRTSFRVVSDADPAAVARIAGVHDVVRDDASVGGGGAGPGAGGSAALRFDVDGSALPAVLPALAAHRVTALTVTPPSLEDLFLRHYGDTPESAPGGSAGAGADRGRTSVSTGSARGA